MSKEEILNRIRDLIGELDMSMDEFITKENKKMKEEGLSFRVSHQSYWTYLVAIAYAELGHILRCTDEKQRKTS